MEKEIKIYFSYVDHEFLVMFFEGGILKKWSIIKDSTEVQSLISEFYFPKT